MIAPLPLFNSFNSFNPFNRFNDFKLKVEEVESRLAEGACRTNRSEVMGNSRPSGLLYPFRTLSPETTRGFIVRAPAPPRARG